MLYYDRAFDIFMTLLTTSMGVVPNMKAKGSFPKPPLSITTSGILPPALFTAVSIPHGVVAPSSLIFYSSQISLL
jgi:hypothetical protein